MAEYTVTGTVDLGALTGELQRSIQRTLDLVSFGLLAAKQAAKKDMILPGAYFQLFLGGKATSDFDEVRANFESWLLTAGLRDCVEAVSAFLEQVRRICAVWSFTGRSQIRGDEWNKRMPNEARRFHKFGLPKKVQFLEDEYDPSLRPESADEILSINVVRNCLVHRQGIGSRQDFNSPEGLMAQWLKMELMVDGPSSRRVIVPPARVEAGERVTIRETKARKLFKLGEPIIFTAQEFSELSWTFFRFGQQLQSNLEAYGRATGVPFKEPEVSTGPSDTIAP